jgi:hypothetical protein
MRTLGLIGRAMRRPLQWRLLVLSPAVLWVAAVATLIPLLGMLGNLLDHSTRWRELTASLDWAALAGIARAMMTPAAAGLGAGIATSLVLTAVFAPFLAGAALVVAEADSRPRFRALLSGAAGHYGRMLRLQIAALLPLALAVVVASLALVWASRASERATSEAATHTPHRIALVVAALAVLLAQIVADAGRARLAVETHRRSALVALGAGIKLVVARPLQALAVGLAPTVISLAVAAVLLVLRQHIAQSGVAALLLAFAFAQLAVASIAWGHAARLCGLVEIARAAGPSRGAAPARRSSRPSSPPWARRSSPPSSPPSSRPSSQSSSQLSSQPSSQPSSPTSDDAVPVAGPPES